MARRLVVGTLKGGATSTTASQLAIWLSLKGLGPVLVGDAGADRSTYEWITAIRERLLQLGGGSPSARIDAVNLSRARANRLHHLERDYAYSVIDVQAHRPELLQEMLKQPDGQQVDLIMPMKPYPLDARSLPRTLALAREVSQHNPVAPRVLLVQVRPGADHADRVPDMLSEKKIARFTTVITLRESIGFSPFTTSVDNSYADVLAELGIIPASTPAQRKDKKTDA
ncbi:hypothetical protein ACIBJI_41960 [Nocardia sp. NPDC050408]|uniref:hypothetical protein n=1 Tax=Nocardia sp. NPDC050408 TaxID=3364319 RepID=UPI00379CC671